MTRRIYLFSLLLSVLAAVHFVGCGLMKSGKATINDPAPEGTVVAQGTISPRNDQSISGTARIYRLTSDSSYVIRLEGFSITTMTGILITGISNNSPDFTTGLRGISGNQNYVTGITSDRIWTEVRLSFGSSSSSTDYGSALLTTVR